MLFSRLTQPLMIVQIVTVFLKFVVKFGRKQIYKEFIAVVSYNKNAVVQY